MADQQALAKTLKRIRKARGLSQEAFSLVSSRTYMSQLERGQKNPTLTKLDEICAVLEIHPVTLVAMIYTGSNPRKIDALLDLVRHEIQLLDSVKAG